MARRRFFVPEVHNNYAELNGDDARHLTQVLRVETGQRYEISDNASIFLAEVEAARKDRVVFHAIEKLPPEPPLVHIALYAALIKFDHLEWIIEKSTELGVERIFLVEATRSERGLERGADKRLIRWRRIALEASQQSRRAHLPIVEGPVGFPSVLAAPGQYRLFLDELRSGQPLLTAIKTPSRADHIAVLLGPEGGWTESERESAMAAGWTSVTLGPQVLRSETAATAALGILNAMYVAVATSAEPDRGS
jgi:16S rRNA (uracil1498-N3)-methyltransferase